MSVVLGVVSEVIFVSGVILELTSGVTSEVISEVATETEETERREGSVSKTEARGRERRQE